MKKIVLSLATLAALSTSALALTNAEFRELERPENKTVYGWVSPAMDGSITDQEGFAAVPSAADDSFSGSAYEKQMRFNMMENPEHY